jgi:DNA polymerase
LQRIFAQATNGQGEFKYRGFTAARRGAWLRIVMPSGRSLVYIHPVADEGGLSYMGVHSITKKWTRIKTHGGKLAENAVQSLSRDVLFDALPHLRKHGYSTRLRVHDEVGGYVPISPELNVGHMSAILATPHDWCEDLPLAAAGFESDRYGKE